ncbi:hypothetical protein [Cupriavidus neocaledonicus]|nr:hypothetical protein [Cupriavidus neocaledonicus]
MPLDTTDYIKLIASSAVVGAAVSAGINWLQTSHRERKNRQHERHHALLDAAVQLERFVKAGGDAIAAERAAPPVSWDEQSWEPYYAVQFPTFTISDAFNWKALRKDEAAQLKDFVEAANGVLSYISDYAEHADDPADVAAEKACEAAEYAQKAWKLAVALRASAGLGPADLAGHHYGWVHEVFEQRLQLRAQVLERRRVSEDEWSKSFAFPPPPAPTA